MDSGDNKFTEKRLRFTNNQNVENIPEILERWFKKEGLDESLELMVTNLQNTDFVVKIADQKFGCHLLVLQCCSEFFQKLDTTLGEVTISHQEVTDKAFQKVYEWMLTDNCQLAVDDLLSLLMAANHLEIVELQSQCWLHIDNEDLFHEHSAFLFYWKGRHLPMADIRDIMLNRIGRFFLSLVACREFVELELDEVTILLRSNLVGVHTEAEILFAAVRWLFHDWSNRKQHLLDIMKCVRFGLMTSWQLTELQRNCDTARLKMVSGVRIESKNSQLLHFSDSEPPRSLAVPQTRY
jgi:BTB And C-terminal Kelch/BTB/POZ domain